MKTFHLDIVTPERSVFSQDVSYVGVPTVDGQIGILARHEGLVSALSQGEIKATVGTKEYFLAIGEGFLEVAHTGVTILVTRAYHADELNEADIKKAQIAAKDALTKSVANVDRQAALAMMRRSVLELKVLRHRRVV